LGTPTLDWAEVDTLPATRLNSVKGALERKFSTWPMPEAKADCSWEVEMVDRLGSALAVPAWAAALATS